MPPTQFPPTTDERPDTREMVVVHRIFRRESRLMPRMVRAVGPGDTGRAAFVGRHVRDYLDALHGHHTAEDEVLWPLLLARVDLERELVARMQSQHEALATTLDSVATLLPRWLADAGADERDALAGALDAHNALIVEHLHEEETRILPVVEEHLTAAEWHTLGARARSHTTPGRMMLFLGALLEDAAPREREEMLARMPAPLRLAWRHVGSGVYERRMARLRENI